MNTENWNDITATKPDEETLRAYDGLVGLTIINIYSLTKDTGVIRLKNFDKTNKEHLYFLRVALMAREVCNFPLEICSSWWNFQKLNWKVKKSFYPIIRAKIDENAIDVQEALDFMRQDGINRLGPTFNFGEIYSEYYERSLN